MRDSALPPSIPLAYWAHVSGGLSGARVWKSDSGLALKRWPRHVTAERLREIHVFQTQLACLPFIPRLIANPHSSTVIVFDGSVWDVSTWMPGSAIERPYSSQLIEAALAAIMLCHERWSDETPRLEVSNLVTRRFALLCEAESRFVRTSTKDILLRDLFDVVSPHWTRTIDKLRKWIEVAVPVQTVFADIHREHLLFESNRLTGLIDFGAVRVDSPACDLARLFSKSELATAENEYRRARPDWIPDGLVNGLAETALVCNLTAWLKRLTIDGEQFEDRKAIDGRIRTLVTKLLVSH